jgi:hypothetical protein
MPITYSLNQTVLINKNSDINLRYIRNNITNIKISAVTPVQTLSIDQNITYLVKVSNSGNTPQKINLEALDSNWNSKFSLNNFNIVPNSVTLLNITLKVPQSASHGLNNVSFMASYSGNYTDFSIPVNVSAYYNTTIKFDAKNTTMYTNNLEIPVIIYNNGNTLEYYNISLLNKAELSDQGWNSTLYYNNVSVTRSLKINAQSSITLILKNVPSSATVAQNITFYVSASDSVKAYTASYSPVLPHMKTGSLTITNLNYTSIPAAFNYNLLLILIIIAAAAFISLIIFFRVRK